MLSTLIMQSFHILTSPQKAGVVSQPPAILGRGKKREVTATPVSQIAALNQITIFEPEKVMTNLMFCWILVQLLSVSLQASDPDFLSALEAMKPDLCITAAYGQYLPKRFLAIPRWPDAIF